MFAEALLDQPRQMLQHHPRMKPVGMCRMCLVQVDGVRGFPPACTTPVTEGMVVHTQNDTVKKIQDGVLEFLLINHPLHCPVCDGVNDCQAESVMTSGAFVCVWSILLLLVSADISVPETL